MISTSKKNIGFCFIAVVVLLGIGGFYLARNPLILLEHSCPQRTQWLSAKLIDAENREETILIGPIRLAEDVDPQNMPVGSVGQMVSYKDATILYEDVNTVHIYFDKSALAKYILAVSYNPHWFDSFSQNRNCQKKDNDKTYIILRDETDKVLVEGKGKVEVDFFSEKGYEQIYNIEIVKGIILKEKFNKNIKITLVDSDKLKEIEK